MSVPLWWNDDGLPVGVHFLGRFGDEATLIRLAAQLEAAQPWAGHRPAVHAANLSGSRAGAAESRRDLVPGGGLRQRGEVRWSGRRRQGECPGGLADLGGELLEPGQGVQG